jgi:hypothetical protein
MVQHLKCKHEVSALYHTHLNNVMETRPLTQDEVEIARGTEGMPWPREYDIRPLTHILLKHPVSLKASISA